MLAAIDKHSHSHTFTVGSTAIQTAQTAADNRSRTTVRWPSLSLANNGDEDCRADNTGFACAVLAQLIEMPSPTATAVSLPPIDSSDNRRERLIASECEWWCSMKPPQSPPSQPAAKTSVDFDNHHCCCGVQSNRSSECTVGKTMQATPTSAASHKSECTSERQSKAY